MPLQPAQPSLQTATLVRYGRDPNLTLQQAIDRLAPGGTLEIYPGTYTDCAVIYKDDVTVRPVDWPANTEPVVLSNRVCQRKGILVIAGTVTLQGFTLQEAEAPPNNNGAGIRFEGGTLVLDQMTFLENENGILTVADPAGRLLVRGSRFEGNGKCEPHCAHGLYASTLAELVVEDSLFLGQRVGHHIKSRAHRTAILRTWIDDGAEGTASYLVDLPNGGDALIADSRLHKGLRSENPSIIINVGTAQPLNRMRRLVLRNNTISSDLHRSVALIRHRNSSEVILDDNQLFGRIEPVTTF